MTKYLPTYLNDHLAGSTVGLELAKRARASNEGTEWGELLDRLAAEIDEDRETLRDVMRRLGVGEDRLKQVGAWTMEKFGRLKPNNQLRGYSPLSRVVELEALTLGVTGKSALWRALDRVAEDEPRLTEFDFTALAERAERQAGELEEARMRAAEVAFSD